MGWIRLTAVHTYSPDWKYVIIIVIVIIIIVIVGGDVK